MADADNLPATTGSAGTLIPSSDSDLTEGFNNLGILRQIGLMVGLAASIAIGFGIVLWAQEPSYRPLLTSLSDAEAYEVTQVLQTNNIQYKIEPNSGAVLVPSDKVSMAKMQLAAAGVSIQHSVGLEILEQDSSLGTSQFVESARFRRGLEGELARTISSLRNVRNARVHLAIPKRSVFVRDRREPRASIFVELGRSKLGPEQVEAIVNLVGSSIPDLDKKNITLVDQRGRLLSQDDVDSDIALAGKQFEYTRKLESVLTRRVENILIPVLGMEGFKAEVSADLNFTAIEQTDEHYNPDLPALRSEQILDENKSMADGAGGVPGALTNQPPAGGTAPEVGGAGGAEGAAGATGNSRSQATRNYELDRTISYTKHQTGRINRLSVAVVIDDIVNNEGTRTPWAETDIQRLTILVKDAVGYDASRGDSVAVINTAFKQASDNEEVFEEPAFYTQPLFIDTAIKVLSILVALFLALFVLRPIMKNLAAGGATSRAVVGAGMGGDLGLAGLDAGGGGNMEIGSLGGGEGLISDGSSLLPAPNASYDQRVNAVKSLVAEDPERVAQVVKEWVNADE